jgi:hypothetical protein
MPNGVSLASNGVFNGMPTKTGTFGPYVFEVTDSKGATASTASLSITVTATENAEVASCAPAGNEAALTPATPYAFLLKGTDGTGSPIAIAGSFTPNGSGGITNAAVDYNGFTSGHEELRVDLAASSYSFGSSAQGCLVLVFSGPITDAASTNQTGASPYFAHGPAVRARNGEARAAAVSSVQFAFSLSGFDGSLYQTGRIMESGGTGGGTNASGFIHAQVPSAFSLNSLQRNFAFGVDGWAAESAGYVRTAIAGTFTNSSGSLSAGYADLNAGGTPSGELTGGKGTLLPAIDATTGRGTGTYTIPTSGGNLTFDFAFYILNESDFILLSSVAPNTAGSAPLLSGRALAATAAHPASALNGYYLLASQGLEVSGSNMRNMAAIGTLQATNAGTIPAAVLYVNDAGSYASTPYSKGSYTVETASGRVLISGLMATPPVVYLTAGGAASDDIAGFLVGSDTQASSGVIVSQSARTPGNAYPNISGNYAAGSQEDVDGLNGASLGEFSFAGTGQYIATQKTAGAVPKLPSSGLIVINADGSGSLDGGSFSLVTDGAVIFAIPDSGDPLIYVFTPGTHPN